MDFFYNIWNWFLDFIGPTFIKDDRYVLFVEGFMNTISLAILSTIMGVTLGIVVAILRVHHIQTGKLKFVDAILRAYIAVIRGTPIVIQLMIIYYIVFASVDSDYTLFVAVFAFGLNSGAYVAEIIRAGILAVDPGQREAGRSLGLSQAATMRVIILPQAIKNILPALGNEFVSILKETSVVGLIPLMDITKAGDLVRSRTYEAFVPLIFVALIYFILVMGISALVKRLERRFAKSDRR